MNSVILNIVFLLLGGVLGYFTSINRCNEILRKASDHLRIATGRYNDSIKMCKDAQERWDRITQHYK